MKNDFPRGKEKRTFSTLFLLPDIENSVFAHERKREMRRKWERTLPLRNICYCFPTLVRRHMRRPKRPERQHLASFRSSIFSLVRRAFHSRKISFAVLVRASALQGFDGAFTGRHFTSDDVEKNRKTSLVTITTFISSCAICYSCLIVHPWCSMISHLGLLTKERSGGRREKRWKILCERRVQGECKQLNRRRSKNKKRPIVDHPLDERFEARWKRMLT